VGAALAFDQNDGADWSPYCGAMGHERARADDELFIAMCRELPSASWRWSSLSATERGAASSSRIPIAALYLPSLETYCTQTSPPHSCLLLDE
jgi:hypothetical protein